MSAITAGHGASARGARHRQPGAGHARRPRARAHSAATALTKKDAPVSYLYPPDKGWVRLDPGQSLDTVSLVDLVVLVEDPADVASMLLRLTDDDIPGVDTRQTALERKFSDVTMLFSALDPRLAQVMFGRLARAVLKLDPDRRNNLLQRTVLPGLLLVRCTSTAGSPLTTRATLSTDSPCRARMNRRDVTPGSIATHRSARTGPQPLAAFGGAVLSRPRDVPEALAEEPPHRRPRGGAARAGRVRLVGRVAPRARPHGRARASARRRCGRPGSTWAGSAGCACSPRGRAVPRRSSRSRR